MYVYVCMSVSGCLSIIIQLLTDYIIVLCTNVCSNNMPVSINFGMRMPSWFDIFGLSDDAKEDTAGVHRAAKECMCSQSVAVLWMLMDCVSASID